MDVQSWNFGITSYGSQLKSCRRLFHEFLNANAVSKFDDYVNKHTCRLLSHLAETPADFMGHIQLLAPPAYSRRRASRAYSCSLVPPGLLSWK